MFKFFTHLLKILDCNSLQWQSC